MKFLTWKQHFRTEYKKLVRQLLETGLIFHTLHPAIGANVVRIQKGLVMIKHFSSFLLNICMEICTIFLVSNNIK